MKTAPIASLVILCHNDGDYLKECLQSVSKHAKVPYEVIIVDNASVGASAKYVKSLSRRAGFSVIRNKENLYFAGGNNQGIEAARGKYVVLLNADAVVGPGWLELMIRCAERDKKIGLVAPRTNGATSVQLVENPGYGSVAKFPAFARQWARLHRGKSFSAHRLIAFCLLIKREVLETVGLLDERFGPGGYEDYDYCLRVQQAGYKAVVAQDVFVHHYGGKGYSNMDYDHHRRLNRELLARKWSRHAFHVLDDMDSVRMALTREAAGAPAGA